MIYIGIDPGLSGGIAAVDSTGAHVVSMRMPATDRDVFDALWALRVEARAVLEFVRSSPQMGVRSVFTFACGYGGLRMALIACGVQFDEVTPQKWQQEMECRFGGKGFGERNATAAKNATKARAQQLFPAVKCTHSISDALLIAEFARRRGLGQVKIAQASRRKDAKTGLF